MINIKTIRNSNNIRKHSKTKIIRSCKGLERFKILDMWLKIMGIMMIAITCLLTSKIQMRTHSHKWTISEHQNNQSVALILGESFMNLTLPLLLAMNINKLGFVGKNKKQILRTRKIWTKTKIVKNSNWHHTILINYHIMQEHQKLIKKANYEYIESY